MSRSSRATLRLVSPAEPARAAVIGPAPARGPGGTEPDRPAARVEPTPTAFDSPLRERDAIERYEIVRQIAAGGMARVYEAVQAFTGRRVALKLMLAQFSKRGDLQARMRAEAMALCQIRHPNVVTVHDAGITQGVNGVPDGLVWIAMELLEGRNLREVLMREGRLPLLEALRVGADIADGVAAAHAMHVIHRDIKPENVFVTDRSEVKVLDLGTAKFGMVHVQSTGRGMAIGTAAYMAPERLDGLPGAPGSGRPRQALVDARSDVYSLGLVLYEMIAGFHPLAPDGVWPSTREVALRQIVYRPPMLASVPPDVWRVVERAIDKDPARRVRSMPEFAAELRAVRHRLLREAAATPSTVLGIASSASAHASAPAAGSSSVSAGQVGWSGAEPRGIHSRDRAERSGLPFKYAVALGAALGTVVGASAFAWHHHRRPSAATPSAIVHAATTSAVARVAALSRATTLAAPTPSATPAAPPQTPPTNPAIPVASSAPVAGPSSAPVAGPSSAAVAASAVAARSPSPPPTTHPAARPRPAHAVQPRAKNVAQPSAAKLPGSGLDQQGTNPL